jgi:hypothetical protein
MLSPNVPPSPWAHNREGSAKDPINIIFPESDWNDVIGAFRQRGWRPPHLSFPPIPAVDLYLHISDQELRQDEQLVKNYLFRGILGYRFHVRLWDLRPWQGEIIGSAHKEKLLTWKHDPLTFEGAETAIAREFKRQGWKISYDAIPLANFLQAPSNDGFATEIRRK